MYSAIEIWGPHLCTGACNPPAEISGGHTVGSREGYVSVLALVFPFLRISVKIISSEKPIGTNLIPKPKK